MSGPSDGATRARVDALSERVDAELDADRRFFRRRTDRRYYVRRSFAAEAEATSIMFGTDAPPAGAAMFTVVHQVALGCRQRALFVAGRGFDTDMSDGEAACLFDALLTDAGFVAAARAAVATRPLT